MVTNLASLMSTVSEEEKKFSNYGFNLRSYAYNTLKTIKKILKNIMMN